MPKFIDLKNYQLKDLLKAYNLSTAGTKTEMVARLAAELEVEELSTEEWERLKGTPTGMQTELNALKETVMSLIEAVKQNQTAESTGPTIGQAEPSRPSSPIASVRSSVATDEQGIVTSHKRFSVKEIGETLPEFDPTNDKSVSVEQFVDYVENAFEAYDFEPKCLLLAVCSRLRGAARLWLDGQTQLFKTWDLFREALIDEFGIDLNEAEVNYKMIACVRRPDEKVNEYCFRIGALGRRYGLSEEATIRYAREGLKNREMQNAVAVIKFATMKQFRETLVEYDKNSPTTSRHAPDTHTNKPFTKRNETRDDIKHEGKRQNDITCFNCNTKGHISKNCPKPQRRERCTVCQKTSHKAENCYLRNQNNTKEKSNVNAIAETKNSYQDVLKVIKVNERLLKAFIDSGSAISLISETAIKGFEGVIECNVALKGFAGGKYIAERKVEVNIEIDKQTIRATLFVVKDEDIPENVLIGRDILCQEGVRFVMEGGKCEIQTLTITEMDEPLTLSQQNMLADIIEEHNECYAKDVSELGKCATTEMVIKLTTEQPINMKPYRVPFAKREIVADIIADLLRNDIIRPSKSDYASPVVLVAKKNGEHRLCVDYRCLNKITVKTPFPMPILEEQFAQLSGNKYFTSLDLRMGYHQIEVHEESKPYTAFITTEGHYEFNRMPFGLVNAPAVFQRLINVIISELKPGEAIAYLDDIILPSKTIEEGLQSLRNLLHVLGRHGLTLRPDKCRYLQTEVQYLGHIVNHEGIKPGKSKVSAIENFKIPENITEVRRFLGLTGFFRKFVADYALITRSITKLLSKAERETFYWNDEQQHSFELLIGKLTNAPVLELYDMTQHHEVHTDACSVGLAGMLLQSTDTKNWKTVMYFSRRCTQAESRYHSHELEVLAVVETLQRFRLYLLGKQFRVITDCAAIALTKDQKELKPRIARWWMKLQEFDFTVHHRAGNRLAHVDAMSRSPDERPETPEPAGFVYNLGMEPSDWIVAMQQQDERARLITNVLLGQTQTNEDEQLKRKFILKNNRLYFKDGESIKLYVPRATRWGLIAHFHDNMGHFAIDKTLQRLQTLFWFPKMRKTVKDYIKACIDCCFNKNSSTKPEGQLHFSPPEPIPFRLLHVDHLGPFVKSKKGNAYILVVTDAFSKFSIIKPVRNTKTTGVINAMSEIISYFGLPTKIVTDRGTCFTSKMFESFCQTNNIIHIKNAVRTPRGNGQVERTNGTIMNAVRCSTPDARNWDADLGKLQWILNSQVNATTKYTPNQIVFNYDVNDAVHNHLVAAVTRDVSNEHIDQSPDDIKEKVLAGIEKEREKWKKRFDAKHATPTEYHENDLVVIRHEPAATGESRKLEPKFKGPYIVRRALGNDRYLVEDVPGMQVTSRKFVSVFASHMLKPWCHGYPELAANDEIEGTDDESADENDK